MILAVSDDTLSRWSHPGSASVLSIYTTTLRSSRGQPLSAGGRPVLRADSHQRDSRDHPAQHPPRQGAHGGQHRAPLSLKTILAYILIFGHFGAPAIGIMGAAVATVVARFVECIAMLTITYSRSCHRHQADGDARHKPRAHTPVRAHGVPVILGEDQWSLGITIYTEIYARIGTGPLAAVSIASTIEGWRSYRYCDGKRCHDHVG